MTFSKVCTPIEPVSYTHLIKSIRPERMKIKLQVIERLPPDPVPPPLRYQVTDGRLTRWVYSPPGYEKEPVVTDFSAP